MVALGDIVHPVPAWPGELWYGGHFYSGRQPSSAVFDPDSNGRAHTGVDLDAPQGSLILAPWPGRYRRGWNPGAGNFLVGHREHDSGRLLYDRHLHIMPGGFLIPDNTFVAAGTPIARVGTTGASAAPHDHFEALWDVPFATWDQDKHIDVEYLLTGTGGRKGDREMITDVQRSLNAHGFTDGNGNQLVEDGIWGPNTAAAFDKMVAAAGAGGGGDHQHTLSGLTGPIA